MPLKYHVFENIMKNGAFALLKNGAFALLKNDMHTQHISICLHTKFHQATLFILRSRFQWTDGWTDRQMDI